jgi:hypothetical protein
MEILYVSLPPIALGGFDQVCGPSTVSTVGNVSLRAVARNSDFNYLASRCSPAVSSSAAL